MSGAGGGTTGRRWRRPAAAVLVVLGAFLGLAAPANADSLWDPNAHCIHAPPSDWITLPQKPKDQFVVDAPSSGAKVAKDVADEIRSKDFFGYYESHLKISALGFKGQPQPYKLFVDPGLPAFANGVTDPLCEDPSEQVIDIGTSIPSELELHVTIAHELFHAAQSAIASTIHGDWWFEATATWAETLFYKVPIGAKVKAVTNHPEIPMDAFNPTVDGAKSPHQYGAWTFVAWMFDRGKIDWAGLHDSFVEDPVIGATNAVDDILGNAGTSFGDEVASYWADHTNPKPKNGPTGKLDVRKIKQETETGVVSPGPQYGARLLALHPAPEFEQLQVVLKKLPAGVQAFVNVGGGDYWHVESGGDFNETFCRSGTTGGSLTLPQTGEVRIAITTTSSTPPGAVDFKTIASKKPCPKALEIQPGIAAGHLHLGMSVKAADQAVPHRGKFVGPVQTPWGEFKSAAYSEAPHSGVIAGFLDGRIAYLFEEGNRYRTTDGIVGFVGHNPFSDRPDLGPTIIPGSTRDEFHADACRKIGSEHPAAHLCWREGPKTRYTFTASLHANPCPNDPDGDEDGDVDVPPCTYPPDDYIVGIGVATHKGLKVARAFIGVPGVVR